MSCSQDWKNKWNPFAGIKKKRPYIGFNYHW